MKTQSYTKNEIFQTKNLDTIFNNLKYNDYKLIAKRKNIETLEDYYFSGYITLDCINDKYFYYRYFGSSGIKTTKTNLKWLLKTIFNDCTHFILIHNKDYDAIIEKYFDALKKEQDTLPY